MLEFFKNHPFAVEAFFESSLVLTFAIPKEQLQGLIPECLDLDTFEDRWAFIAVAMVDAKALRPKGFPKIMGNNFFLIGYRIFVRYVNNAGKRLRGLYIIRSETDKRKMAFLGNIFTHYNYSTTDITQIDKGDSQEIISEKSDFKITVGSTDGEIPLPQNSPFNDWKEARRFAGPLPFTFTFKKDSQEVLIIQGVRQNWKPEPVEVIEHNISFLEDFRFTGMVLANAFVIRKIPYQWKKGSLEKWSK